MLRSRTRRRLAVFAVLALALAGVGAAAYVASRDAGTPGAAPPATTGAAPGGPVLTTVFSAPKVTAARPGGPGGAGVGRQPPLRPTYVPGRLVVKFRDGTARSTVNRVLARADAELERTVAPLDARVVEVAPRELRDAIDTLDDSAAVEYVERDLAVEQLETLPNDSLWSTQWGPRHIDAPQAWDATTGAAAVVVAVIDTGVDARHPDLRGALVAGWDFVNGDSDASDDEGHGTATAGVIAARTNNRRGQAGICWKCSIMPVKVLGADGSGSMSTVAAGIVWAVDHGARVVNLSLGGVGTTQTLTDAVAYAAGKGAVVVAAAGNSGVAAPLYPAAYPEVLGIAATTRSDSLYSWSNYGPEAVELAAPGCNTAPSLDGGYVNFCGTSSAAPVVAGLVGLALSAKPAATRLEIEQALAATATPVPSAVRYGRVNAKAALAKLGIRAVSAKKRSVRRKRATR